MAINTTILRNDKGCSVSQRKYHNLEYPELISCAYIIWFLTSLTCENSLESSEIGIGKLWLPHRRASRTRKPSCLLLTTQLHYNSPLFLSFFILPNAIEPCLRPELLPNRTTMALYFRSESNVLTSNALWSISCLSNALIAEIHSARTTTKLQSILVQSTTKVSTTGLLPIVRRYLLQTTEIYSNDQSSGPLCNEPVAVRPGQDPNDRMEDHFAKECSVMTGHVAKKSTPTCAHRKCGKVLFAPIRCDVRSSHLFSGHCLLT